MAKSLSNLVRWLHKWGFFTDTRRKQVLYRWQEESKSVISKMENEMDPFIARLVYNERYSTKLYQLPDGIFLRIFEFLYQDDASIFILRQICRRFRLILKSPQFSFHRFRPSTNYEVPNVQNRGELFLPCPKPSGKPLPSPPLLVETEKDAALRAKIAILLHIDSYCVYCLKRERPERRASPRGGLGFCNLLLFRPSTDMMGHVRLCEHQVISWMELRSFLTYSSARIPANSDPDFEFEVDIKTCRHIEHHHGRCIQNGPRACLFYRKTGQWRLELTWEPHSGLGTFKLYRPGKFNAIEMRTMFRRYRNSAAQYMVPEIVPGVLPEMTCFRVGECDCLSYGDEEKVHDLLYGIVKSQVREGIKTTHVPLDSSSEQCSHQQPYQASQHVHVRVDLCRSASRQEVTLSPCIVTFYKRVIEGYCQKEAFRAIPSHDWLHARERSSYSDSRRPVKENCTDPSCRNNCPLSIYGCHDRELHIGVKLPFRAPEVLDTQRKAKKSSGDLTAYLLTDNPADLFLARR
ncbi:unnamed protein product [Clonostachys rosea]|uniref:F-box domain-containing protein n=1 Tax=Bionectria ochroleuca TaxID=29856 RepID=A0ABY6TTE0_BIOOC|nr:unnamed protein product [Clonostachys rosea]